MCDANTNGGLKALAEVKYSAKGTIQFPPNNSGHASASVQCISPAPLILGFTKHTGADLDVGQ